MKALRYLIVFLFISCATNSVEAWVEDTVSFEEQEWRVCTKEFDGQEKHLEGFCYISRECRKRRFRSRICRPLPKFVSFTDKPGVLKLVLSGKVMVKPDI